ncbi:MAG: hypothetical protein ACO2YV_08865, partial [Pseudomonadales bacterium]
MANGVPTPLGHYGPDAPVVLEQPLPREALPTPALVLQRSAFERNLTAMQSLVSGYGLGLRPHGK